jgi:gamma-syntrophin
LVIVCFIYFKYKAEQCGQLKVGDAILKVNNIDITQLTHEQAVNVLKSTSAPSSNWNGISKRNSTNIDTKMDYDVILTVKNYSSILEKFRVSAAQSLQNITQQLTDSNKQNHVSKNETQIDGEPGWIDLISIPLELAYITQYIPGTDRLRDLAFEVYSKTGISSGILLCDSAQKKNDLIQKINQNIQLCNASYVSLIY